MKERKYEHGLVRISDHIQEQKVNPSPDSFFAIMEKHRARMSKTSDGKGGDA